MTQMQLHTGAEGPAYDPYHFDELTVKRPSGTTVIHAGLGTWCEYKANDGRKFKVTDEVSAFSLFEATVGISFNRAMRAHRYVKDVLPYKLHAKRCGGVMQCVDGYPGETMDYCNKCGFVAGYHMNYAAIE